jgi:hypothetical protein
MIPAPRNPPRQLIAGWSDFEVILGLGHGEFGLIEEPRRHGHDFICGIPQSTRPRVRAISVNLVASIVFTPIRYYTNIPHVLLVLQLAAKGERISRTSATSHSIHCLNVVSSTTSAPPLPFNQATSICKPSPLIPT